MFDQIRNVSKVLGSLGNPKELQAKFAQIQEDLARKTVEADAGAGAVRITMNGKFQVTQVQLDPVLVASLAGAGADADREMVQDLIAAAVNAAQHKAREMAQEELANLTAGVNIPGIEKLLGANA